MSTPSPQLIQAMVATSQGRLALILDKSALASKRPMVMFVHGALRTSSVFAPWLPILSSDYDVVLVDLPGHGRSPGEGPAGVRDIAQRLREIIHAHFRDRRIVVIGESTGGIIAACLGDGATPAIAGVVAADPPLTAGKQWPIQMNFTRKLAGLPDDAYLRTFGHEVFGIAKDGKVTERIYYDIFQRVAVPTLVMTGDAPLWPTTGRIGVPCLLDEVDKHVLISFGNPRIAIETIAGAGHILLAPPGDRARALVTGFCAAHFNAGAKPDTAKPSPPASKAPPRPAREEIEAYLADGHRPGALAAARGYWQADPSASAARYVTSLIDKLWPAARVTTHRVAFLRSFTVEPMVPMLQAEAALDGCRVEAWVGDFNAYGQDILNPASALYASKPDTIVFAVQLRDISPDLWARFADLPEGEVEGEADRAAETVIDLLSALRQRTSAHILVHGFERPLEPSLGILDARRKTGQGDAIARLNGRIRAFAAGERGITWLDYDELQSRFGRAAWIDDRKWLTARLPLSVDAMPRLAAAWWRHIAPLARPQAKVLVLDLDNTLWGGTVGEDGVAGLKLGADYPGAYFQSLQRAALDLARRGVLLAIASKNNEADAMEVIAGHPGMLIRPEHIAAHRINWQPKPQNIAEMAKELNLGLDSFVFLDDNPAEREAVRRGCPDVTVVELPKDPARYAECLRRVAAFERHAVLEEDRDRTRLYREERERRDLMSGAGSLEEYLHALKVGIDIKPMTAATLARAAQLTQKTNQLNMTTRRYTEAQLEAVAREPGVGVYVLNASDRFGDNGLVGVAITRTAGPVTGIDTFLLSCRVIGRGVETAFLAHLAEAARAQGSSLLSGWFLKTAKNAPAADIYKNAGFHAAETTPVGQLWTFDLATRSLSAPPWIAMAPGPLQSVA